MRNNLLLIGELMFALLVGAAIEGAFFPGAAQTLSAWVPFDLAIMIAALGATIPLKQLLPQQGDTRPALVILATQLVALPLFAFVAARALPNDALRAGLIVTALAPAEITSGTMVMLAGGDTLLAVRLMVGSLGLAVVTIPLGLRLFGGVAVPVEPGAILLELVLVVLLPFLLGSAARQRWPRLESFRVEFNATSALAVVLLIFIVGAQIRASAFDFSLLFAAGAALALNGFGYLLGWVVSVSLKLPGNQRHAAVLSSGMREFGVATAVAIPFLAPAAASVPALYGLVMLLTASALAKAMRVRDRERQASGEVLVA